jgi:hypothetical protein
MSYPVLFSIIGAITGLIVSQLSIHIHGSSVNYFLFAHVLLVATFSFIWKKQPTPKMLKSLVVMGTILFGLTAWFIWQDYHHTRRLSPLFIISLIQITVICTAFIQSWKPNKPHYVYSDLFENAWNNHFFLIFSGLLTGGFLAVLGLGTSLFDSIGIKISSIIWSKEITPIIVATLVGAGIGISREYGSLIFKIRSVFFAIFRVMAYLAAGIVILFTASLPFSVNTLFDNRNTSLILLSVVAVSILLLNTLVDTSKDKDAEKLPVWKNRVFSAQIILLPFLSLLSVYAISLRILQYGLMPKRVIAITVAVLLSIYSLAYLYQLIKNKGHWTNGLAKINPPLAGLWVAMLIALSSPLIDPVRLSVNNQVERLEANKVAPEEFDFNSLKYRLGKRGEEAIKDIRTWKNHPQIALIEQHIDKPSKKYSDKELVVNVIGDPPADVEKLKSRYGRWNCSLKNPCYIKQLSLDNTGEKRTVVFNFTTNTLQADLYSYANHTWRKVKTFSVPHIWDVGPTGKSKPNLITKEQRQKIIEALKQDEQKLIPPKTMDIEVGGIELR